MQFIPQWSYAVAIPVYNDPGYLETALEAIRLHTQDVHQCSVYVYDDGSPDKTNRERYAQTIAEVNASWPNDGAVLIEYGETNRGVPYAWNRLLHRIFEDGNHDVAAVLNSDILATPRWLYAGAYFYEHNMATLNQFGALGWQVFTPKTRNKLQYLQDMIPYLHQLDGTHTEDVRHETVNAALRSMRGKYPDYPELCGCAIGCSFALSQEQWRATGDFDENFRAFFDEIDYGARILMGGRYSVSLPWPFLVHAWSGTFAANVDTLKPHDLMAQSKKYFCHKYGLNADEMDNPAVGKYVHHKYAPPVEHDTARYLYPRYLETGCPTSETPIDDPRYFVEKEYTF